MIDLALTNGNLQPAVASISTLIDGRLNILTAHALIEAHYALAARHTPWSASLKLLESRRVPETDPGWAAFEAEWNDLMAVPAPVTLEPVPLSRILASANLEGVGVGRALLVLRELGVVVNDLPSTNGAAPEG